MPGPVICPSCNEPAEVRSTRYGLRNRCQACGLHSWGMAPLETVATHEARKAAHEAFDVLWKSGRVKRGLAYQLLAEELGLSRADCHMKIMDEATALKVPAAAARIAATLP